ncbi:MAG: ATP-binding protein [Deltaproteobacteria bacterium]|nr:ATP-binding protein [Deltaproteobacteria bacterium]
MVVTDTKYRRVLRAPGQSFFLLGPRGTGKSTWLRMELADARRIDLLDEEVYQSYLVRPALLADELRAVPPGSWVALDEVQRLPDLLNQAHRFIEERGLRFALCGSSARKLKRHGTNLLAGRALRLEMHPFLPEELGSDFSLGAALAHGTLPVVWQSGSRSEALSAYARLYLREEIQAEATVRNLPGFARFLPIAALFHGRVLNVAGLARDAGVSRTTVDGYLEVLEDTLIAWRLPAFEARLRVRERRHPKLYLFDPGVVRALKGRPAGPPAHDEVGPLFEGWVASVLRAHASTRDLFEELAYWAPAEARTTEVDFLLRRGSDLLAVEAKAGIAARPADLTGLRAIAGLRGLVRRVIVCTAERPRLTEDGIEVLPVADFLDQVQAGRLWP